MRRALILVLIIFAISHGDSIISNTIVGAGTIGPYQLGYQHILVDSDSVNYRGLALTRTVDYQINYNDGYIVFAKPAPMGDTIIVRFAAISLKLKTSYALIRPLAVESGDMTQAVPNPGNLGQSSDQGGLSLLGSQRFIVNIGNRGEPSLSQSLDLTISGQLAQGVSVKGSISDRNFNNASGNTSSLDELDKILLHLDAPGVKADFGDLELNGVENSLFDFRRKLTGINIQAEKSNFKSSSGLAFSPGEQIEQYFFGVDGKQGPYFISNSTGSQTLSSGLAHFLAGTEEIYLDGRKLERGNENDYTIDYYQGYIEFTPKNVISSRNRITIKIQAANDGYRRTFVSGNAFADKGLNIGVQLIREGDDKSRPRSFDMGDQQSELLRNAGANSDLAYLSGATFAGTGLGNYSLYIDSLGDSVYTYVGADSGEYQINFSYRGQGKGSYQYNGNGKYTYVGDRNGSYAPMIYYPLPQTINYGSIMVRRDGALYFNSELAISQDDRNTMSSIDKQLIGYGFNGSLGWRFVKRPFLGKSWDGNALEMRFRSLDSDFHYPGSINPVEFSRQYNLPDYYTGGSGRLTELRSAAKSPDGNYFDFGAGEVVQDSLKSNRGCGKLGYVTLDRILLTANADISRASLSGSKQAGWWNKYEAGGRIIKGAIQPSLAIRHELKTSVDSLVTGQKSDEYESGLGWNVLSGLNSSSKLLIRNQNYSFPRGSIWRKQYDQYQLEQQLTFDDSKSGLSVTTNLARLYQKYRYPQIDKTTRNLGSIKINYTKSAIGITFYENVNGTARVLQTREYLYVGKGKGDYRRDGSDYVAEPGGEYVEIIRQSNEQAEGASGYQIMGGFRARYDGNSSDYKSLERLNIESDLNYQQNLYPQIRLDFDKLFPFGHSDSSEVSYRNYNYRQKIRYRLNNRGDYLAYSLNLSRNTGSQYQFENLASRLLENQIETKISSGNRASYLLTGKLADDVQTLYSGKVDIDRIQVGFAPDYQIASGVRITALFGILNEQENIQDLQVTTYSITPKTIGNIRNVIRLECEISYSSVRFNRTGAIIPYVLAESKKPGDNYNLQFNARFKLNRYGEMMLLYNYKKLGDGYSNYNFRAEAKAEF
jgi:hypothetical protein